MHFASFRSFTRRPNKSSAPRTSRPARPAVETLEDRSLPSATMLTQLAGTTSTSFGGAVAFQNHLYFTASLGQSTGLYVSDGTAAGTTLVKALSGGQAGANPQFTVVNNTLFFEWDNDLWESDGTAAGTGVLKNGAIGEPGPSYTPLPILNGTLYFLAPDQTQSGEAALWKTDGTAAGTVEVNLTSPLVGKALYDMSDLIAANGKLYFEAQNPDDLNAATAYLWSSDGTAAGTVPLLGIVPLRRGDVTDMAPFDGALYFTTNNYDPMDDQSWVSLYRTDGTTKGTIDLQDIDNQYNATSLTVVNNKLYFFMDNVPIDGITGYPSVLSQTDGTTSGTAYVADLSPPVGGFGDHPVLDATAYDGALYFAAWDSTDGTELWKSDGTTGGTALLKDINPGAGGSEPIDGDPGLSSYQLTVSGGKLFFTADDGVHGDELWETDGTRAGTVMVADINPGAQGSFLQNLTDVNGTLFFTGDDGTHGEQLWAAPAASPLSATGQTIAATQGQTFSGQVATFSDPTPLTPASYSATITWGDGQTSAGTVAALGNGQFAVSGSNSYGWDGTYGVSVQIDRAGGGSVTVTTTATVSPTVYGTSIKTVAGQTFSVEVASFVGFGAAVPGTYTATINWGDGQTSAGTLGELTNVPHVVSGSHAYARAGTYTVSVQVNRVGGGGATATMTATVAASPSVWVQPILTTVGENYSYEVATFTGPGPEGTTAETPTINWGDGQGTSADVTPVGDGSFAVSGTHTYTVPGTYTVKVQIDLLGGDLLTATTTATVSPHPSGQPIKATAGQAFSGVVATFSDPGPGAATNDTATISWGDGDELDSPGTITALGNGLLAVSGTHVYAEAGVYYAAVGISLTNTRSDGADMTAVVSPSSPAPPIKTSEGQLFSGVVANFIDPAPQAAGADTASITWGDGQTSAGTVTAVDNGFFAVSGSHAYAHAGTYAVSVQINRAGATGWTVTTSATVADAPFWATRTFQRVEQWQPVTGVLGTLTDLNPLAAAGDFTAQIDWGDGTKTAGTLQPAGQGAFSITGNHVYATAGARTLTVTVTDEGGRTATTNPLIAVDATPPPLSAAGQPIATQEGQPFSGVVATFSDPSPAPAGAYAAAITWGDGQTSAGTVAALGNGQFAVSGSNTYAHAGAYAVSVQVSRPGGVTVAAATTANVADAPFWATRTFQRVGQGQPVTGVLGTLVDLNPLAAAGDFTVTIDWGDGTQSQGLLLPMGKGTFDIAGTHDYTSAGARTLAVTITDEDGRTVTTDPLITVDF